MLNSTFCIVDAPTGVLIDIGTLFTSPLHSVVTLVLSWKFGGGGMGEGPLVAANAVAGAAIMQKSSSNPSSLVSLIISIPLFSPIFHL
jgi:hypothetical protein